PPQPAPAYHNQTSKDAIKESRINCEQYNAGYCKKGSNRHRKIETGVSPFRNYVVTTAGYNEREWAEAARGRAFTMTE
ncbi:MAG: hypothetical protein KC418_18465, partial [Anaerolineales bacterium]|nr:hypothetical protein [Anaerolineales bacterium]